jgi:hypothetical protein
MLLSDVALAAAVYTAIKVRALTATPDGSPASSGTAAAGRAR